MPPATTPTTALNLYQYRATDNAGNVSSTGSCTVNIDTTNPTVTDNAPAGWSNSAVTVTLSPSDAAAPASPTCSTASPARQLDDPTANQFQVAAPSDHSNDGAHNYQYQALDNAGNVSSTGTCTVNIDTTTPTVTRQRSRHGWSNSAVTVTITADDTGGSGIDRCSTTSRRPARTTWRLQFSSALRRPLQRRHLHLPVPCYRQRRNASSTGSCTVNIDTTNPTVTDDAPAGWSNSAVTVTLSPSDGGSGIAKTQYRLVGSSTWIDATDNQFQVAAPADHSNDGTHNYEYRALDNAGNVSSTGSCTVKIDTTTPTVTDDAPAGWSNSAVTVTLSPSDGSGDVSGIAKTQYRLVGSSTWIDAT